MTITSVRVLLSQSLNVDIFQEYFHCHSFYLSLFSNLRVPLELQVSVFIVFFKAWIIIDCKEKKVFVIMTVWNCALNITFFFFFIRAPPGNQHALRWSHHQHRDECSGRGHDVTAVSASRLVGSPRLCQEERPRPPRLCVYVFCCWWVLLLLIDHLGQWHLFSLYKNDTLGLLSTHY